MLELFHHRFSGEVCTTQV